MSAQDAEIFVAMLAQLAKDNPGQAISLVEQDGEILLGVMNILPEQDDWCINPVPVARLIAGGMELKSAA